MLSFVPYLISLLIHFNYPLSSIPANTTLAEKTISLENRYPDKFVNNVFKDNILLTLSYMDGDVTIRSEIKWDDIEKPQNYGFALNPGESFAFHDQVLIDFDNNIVKTTNAHFNYEDGFKSDGFLMGDGVCHLASLMYWASLEARLSAVAPTSHDFAVINEIPKEYGVSIYSLPGSHLLSAKQNLYIINNLDKTIVFVFVYDKKELKLKIVELASK